MTNEDRRELRTALSVILTNISELKRQSDAALAVLAKNYPAIHAAYEIALDAERKNPINESSALLEHLDRTLLRNKE